MTDIQINKQINVQVIVMSGGPISAYEWKLDDVIQSNNTNTLIISPNTLSTGLHTIKFKGQNYCGNYSDELIENINIIEETNMVYEQTDPLNVNQATISMVVKLRRTSTVTVTLTDEADIPMASTQVSIAEISGTTDASGVVTLSAVPYGTQIITTSIP